MRWQCWARRWWPRSDCAQGTPSEGPLFWKPPAQAFFPSSLIRTLDAKARQAENQNGFDLFKDIVFAGFCFQSHSLLVQFLAPCSLAYSLLIHVYFICDDSVLAELSQCYIPLLLLRSSPPSIDVEVAEDGNTVACSVWPIFYRQTTPTKRPVLQLSLAFLLFHPLRRATGPFLGHRVARALQDHDCHYAQRLWEEAEAEKDLDLFKAMLPEIRQLRQAFQLQVGEPLSEDSLLLIREWWPVLVEQTTEVSLYGHDLQADGAKVLSKALEVNRSLQKLSLVGNALSDFGVQARRSNLEPGEEAPCMRVWGERHSLCSFSGLVLFFFPRLHT
eukprot:g8102.t1